MVFPTHPEVGWILIVGGVLTSILAEMNQRWPGPLEAFVGRLLGSAAREPDTFIPLPEAARQIYEANLNRPLGMNARFDWGSGVDPLRWCAYLMTGRGLVVYGRRPPSTVLEIVPADSLRAGTLTAGAEGVERDGFDSYVDLQVKRGDLRNMLQSINEDRALS